MGSPGRVRQICGRSSVRPEPERDGRGAQGGETQDHQAPGGRLRHAGCAHVRQEGDRGRVRDLAVVAPSQEAQIVGRGVRREVHRDILPVGGAFAGNVHQRRRRNARIRIGVLVAVVAAAAIVGHETVCLCAERHDPLVRRRAAVAGLLAGGLIEAQRIGLAFGQAGELVAEAAAVIRVSVSLDVVACNRAGRIAVGLQINRTGRRLGENLAIDKCQAGTVARPAGRSDVDESRLGRDARVLREIPVRNPRQSGIGLGRDPRHAHHRRRRKREAEFFDHDPSPAHPSL
jgi:hypothetical protein